jgi:tetratricopeptide (TPR) repeat protein
LRKYEEAKKCFDEAKTLLEAYFQAGGPAGEDEFKTDYANILRTIGSLCFMLDDHKEAMKYYQMATHEDPTFALAWNSKGYHIIVSYDKLIEITSKREVDLIREAISYFEEAIACFHKKAERDPNIAYAYYNKGYAHFLLKQYKDAVQCFEDTIRVKPRYADAWNGKGVCTYLLHSENKNVPFTELSKIKKYFDEAISSYTEKDALDWDNNPSDQENLAYTFYNKAILLKQLGSYEQAVGCFDQAIDTKQQFFESWYSRGIILNDLERYKQAVGCFDQAIKDYSDANENCLFDLYVARGQAKYNIGDRIGALEDFTKVGDEEINDRRKSQKYNNIGVYYHQDGDYKKAQSMYEEAITKDPAFIDAHYNLAVLHINKNEFKEAKKSLDKCLEIEVTEREPKVAARTTQQKLAHSRPDWTFEFDSLPPSAKRPVDLDPIIHIPGPPAPSMPFESQPQSFIMSLKYQNLMRQQPPMPIDPVRIPRLAAR